MEVRPELEPFDRVLPLVPEVPRGAGVQTEQRVILLPVGPNFRVPVVPVPSVPRVGEGVGE